MKKILGIIGVSVLLVGCGNPKENNKNANVSKQKKEVLDLIKQYEKTSKSGDNAKIINLEK